MNRLKYIDVKHYPHLDGIRGAALILVLLAHFYHFKIGFIAMDCFFVLSGFLITRILLTTRPSVRSLFNFIARRFLRIFPIYYLVLFLFFVFFKDVFLENYPAYIKLYENQAYFWCYLQNVYIVNANQFETIFLRHFWSLAIEEQFYIFWPLIVFLFHKAHKILIPIILILILIAGLLKIQSDSFEASYMLIQYRMDCILCGALIAFSLFYNVNYNRLLLQILFGLCIIAILTIGMIANDFGETNLIMAKYGFSVIGYMFAIFILLTLVEGGFGDAGRRIFDNVFLREAGKYSYTIYVIHWPILLLLGTSDFMSHISSVFLRSTMILIFSVILGVILYHVYEKHFLKLKRYFPVKKYSK